MGVWRASPCRLPALSPPSPPPVSPAPTAPSWCSTASISRSVRAAGSVSWGPTGWARAPCCASSPDWSRPTAASWWRPRLTSPSGTCPRSPRPGQGNPSLPTWAGARGWPRPKPSSKRPRPPWASPAATTGTRPPSSATWPSAVPTSSPVRRRCATTWACPRTGWRWRWRSSPADRGPGPRWPPSSSPGSTSSCSTSRPTTSTSRAWPASSGSCTSRRAAWSSSRMTGPSWRRPSTGSSSSTSTTAGAPSSAAAGSGTSTPRPPPASTRRRPTSGTRPRRATWRTGPAPSGNGR